MTEAGTSSTEAVLRKVNRSRMGKSSRPSPGYGLGRHSFRPRLQRFYGQLQQEQRLALALYEHSSRELGHPADDHRQLLDALHGTPEQAQAALTAHLHVGAAELQRLLDLLAYRKQLAHRKESETPRD